MKKLLALVATLALLMVSVSTGVVYASETDDTNADGVVDTRDAMLLYLYASGKREVPDTLGAWDVTISRCLWLYQTVSGANTQDNDAFAAAAVDVILTQTETGVYTPVLDRDELTYFCSKSRGVITSYQDFEAYCEEIGKNFYCDSNTVGGQTFDTVKERFTEAFFETHDLALTINNGFYDGNRYSLQNVEYLDNGDLNINLLLHGGGIQGLYFWQLFIPLEKGSYGGGNVSCTVNGE